MSRGKAWKREKVIRTLEPFFKLGCNPRKACEYAGIPYSTIDTWIQKDEALRLQFHAWQNEVSVSARKVWKKAIDDNNVPQAVEWLKRKEKEEFSDRTETDITTKGEQITVGIATTVLDKANEILKEDKLNEPK
jgi:hypothetical protein